MEENDGAPGACETEPVVYARLLARFDFWPPHEAERGKMVWPTKRGVGTLVVAKLSERYPGSLVYTRLLQDTGWYCTTRIPDDAWEQIHPLEALAAEAL